MLSTRTLLPALAAAAALVPATAEAKTYCATHEGIPCPAGSVTTGLDVQAAINAAAVNPGADTVRITPGNYDVDANGLDVPAGDALTIDGTGATLQADALVAGETVLDAAGATVRGLRLQLVDGVYRTGIRSTGGVLIDVFAGGTGPEQRGAQLGNSAKAIRLAVDLDGTSAVGVAGSSGAAIIEDSTLDATTAVFASGPMTKVDRSVLKGAATTNGGLVLRDTVVRPRNGASGLNLVCTASGATLQAEHVTVTGTAAGTAGAGMTCNGGGSAKLVLRSSILATPKSVRVHEFSGTTSVDANRSALDPGALDEQSGHVDLALAGTLPVPQFATPADPELPDGSPLIDAADPATASAADLKYRERPRDGDGDGVALPDVGALEHPTVPLKAQPAAEEPQGPQPPAPQDPAPTTTPVPVEPPVVTAPVLGTPRTAPPAAAPKPDLARALRAILAARRAGRSGARYTNLAGAKLTITWKVGKRTVAKGTATGKGVRVKPKSGRLRRGAKVTVAGTLVLNGKRATAKLTQRAR